MGKKRPALYEAAQSSFCYMSLKLAFKTGCSKMAFGIRY
jgi:hypothetical protein